MRLETDADHMAAIFQTRLLLGVTRRADIWFPSVESYCFECGCSEDARVI